MPGARTTRVTRPRTTDVNPPTAETRPAKRSRRTRTTEPSHLSTPPRDVVANESTWNDTAETAGETDKNGGTDGELSDQESLPHALPLDPALLDEEDAPAAPNSSADGPKPRRGGYAGGYDARKSFGGQLYSGMSVGSSHTWQYDPGEWRETKEEPDLWQIDFEVAKHRKRRAPEGSGAPVGTEYHWFIVAHQVSAS